MATAGLFAQSLQFEVASLRPSEPRPDQTVSVGLRMDGSQARIGQFTLRDYLAFAYRVKRDQVTGPEWISTTRFDLNAKLPDGATAAQVPEMLQALLVERLQIKMHREKKDFPIYALIKDPKNPLTLKPVTDQEAGAAPAVEIGGEGSAKGVSVNLGNGSYYFFADNKFEFKRVQMPTMATALERYLDRPVLDFTELPGRYDITLPIAAEDFQPLLIRAAVNSGVQLAPPIVRMADGVSNALLQDPMQKVGLKLEARKAPLDLIVVDSALRTPTDN